MNKGLLDRLAEEVGTSFLSDLHGGVDHTSLASAVNKIDPEQYPVEEWEEAVGYITGGKSDHFESQELARRYLSGRLSGREKLW